MLTNSGSGPGEPAKRSRAEDVARALSEHIRRSRLPAGHRLGTKDDLRTRYAIAPATLNEALRILDIEGIVVARPGPGGGIFVAAPSMRRYPASLTIETDTEATLAEWREIRDNLEPLVCRKAARRCTSRDTASLRRIITEMSDLVDDLAAFLTLHWSLHRRLAEMGDNPPLTGMYLRLLDIMEKPIQQEIMNDALYDPPVNLEIHQKLVEAVIDGGQRNLETAIRRHTPRAKGS